MSAHAATAHTAHAHHDTSFVRTYVFSTDHKMIARQFLFMGLFMMIIGGLLALMVRWQLAWPETAMSTLRLLATAGDAAGCSSGAADITERRSRPRSSGSC